MAEGQYFGDEEGFEETRKQYYAKVTALDTVLFSINKSKIRLNINEVDPRIYKGMIKQAIKKSERLKRACDISNFYFHKSLNAQWSPFNNNMIELQENTAYNLDIHMVKEELQETLQSTSHQESPNHRKFMSQIAAKKTLKSE